MIPEIKIMNHLDRVNLKSCIECGNDSWHINFPINCLPMMDNIKKGLPIVAMTCFKCGYVKMFNYQMIEGLGEGELND